jgi:hypothetical protein
MRVKLSSSVAPPVSSIPQVFQTVEGYRVPVFFSRYPVGISNAPREVEEALRSIDEEASEEGSRERRRALIRHTNPYGDPFTICHCSAFPERLILLACLIEVMWIHDGRTPTFLKTMYMLIQHIIIYRRDGGDGSQRRKSPSSLSRNEGLTSL